MPITNLHPQYSARVGQWQRVRDCFDGQDAVKLKRTTYLPTLEGQKATDDSYTAYVERALFYPALERTVMGLIGMLLRRAPTVEVPEVVQKDLEDITLADDTFDMLVLEVCQEMLLGGRVVLQVDWQDALKRPYWTVYPAEALVNWREEVIDGERRLVLAVFKERVLDEEAVAKDPFSGATIEQFVEFALVDKACVVRKHRRLGDEWRVVDERQPARAGEALEFLPLIVFGPRGLYVPPDKPPLLDLVDLNLSHYRTSADLEHGRHFTALPTPYVTGWTGQDEKLRIGAGVAWMVPDANAKVGMLEFTGQGLSELRLALEQKERQMAVIGARMLESQPRQAETAEAVRLRQTGDTATLGTLAQAISLGLQSAMRWHGWWYTQDEQAISVELSRDFLDTRLTPQEAEALFTQWQGGGISYATYFWNLQQGEWMRPDVTMEEERALIDADEDMEPEPPPPPAPVMFAQPPPEDDLPAVDEDVEE